MKITNIAFTHQRCPVGILEQVSFQELEDAYEMAKSIDGVLEAVLVQTCNRTELFTLCEDPRKTIPHICQLWASKTRLLKDTFHEYSEIRSGVEALRHLLYVSSGLESMAIGENQILGQLKESLASSKDDGMTGPILSRAFRSAIALGARVRSETGINKGPASLGAVLARHLERRVKNPKEKEFLIVGAGEAATMVAKAFRSRGWQKIHIANRHESRAQKLADMVGGEGHTLRHLGSLVPNADVVVVATDAGHPLLVANHITKAQDQPRKVLVVDLSGGTDIESSVREIEGVSIVDLDSLKATAEEALKRKRRRADKAKAMVEKELPRIERMINREMVEPEVARTFRWAEDLRKAEVEKAMARPNGLSESDREVIEDLTKILVKRLLTVPAEVLREAAEKGHAHLLEDYKRLFNRGEEV
ncbi:MAG: glutamyl-tRNA reductase [Candidatus Geothermarchaeales archaeon]